jgi:hypothetical protein
VLTGGVAAARGPGHEGVATQPVTSVATGVGAITAVEPAVLEMVVQRPGVAGVTSCLEGTARVAVGSVERGVVVISGCFPRVGGWAGPAEAGPGRG